MGYSSHYSSNPTSLSVSTSSWWGRVDKGVEGGPNYLGWELRQSPSAE